MHLPLFLGAFLIAGAAVAQPLWPIEVSADDFALLDDTSATALRELISDEGSLYWWQAARVLARKATPDDQTFLLDHLRTPVYLSGQALLTRALGAGHTIEDLAQAGYDPATFDPARDNDWDRYYLFNELRGYFGIADAVAGMDTLATFAPMEMPRIEAIRRLAQAGHFDYFEDVREAFLNQQEPFRVLHVLTQYGEQPTYRDAVANLISQNAQSADETADRLEYAAALASVDSAQAMAFLADQFATASGPARYAYFLTLRGFDPSHEPELVMWAVVREPDEDHRSYYVPSYYQVERGDASRLFVSPRFVRFARQWGNSEPSTLIVQWLAREFLDDYRPLYGEAGADSLLDTLSVLVDTLTTYEWIAPVAFSDTLRSMVQSAEGTLSTGDSTAAIATLTQFQAEIEAARDEPVQGVRVATDDGHRFLWWTAQYVIDLLE